MQRPPEAAAAARAALMASVLPAGSMQEQTLVGLAVEAAPTEVPSEAQVLAIMEPLAGTIVSAAEVELLAPLRAGMDQTVVGAAAVTEGPHPAQPLVD